MCMTRVTWIKENNSASVQATAVVGKVFSTQDGGFSHAFLGPCGEDLGSSLY